MSRSIEDLIKNSLSNEDKTTVVNHLNDIISVNRDAQPRSISQLISIGVTLGLIQSIFDKYNNTNDWLDIYSHHLNDPNGMIVLCQHYINMLV